MDIFGNGYVLRDGEGWQITAEGREFLAFLEAVTQDNLPQEIETGQDDARADDRAELIVVGHRFRNRLHRPGTPPRKVRGAAGVRRGENASN